MGLRGAEVSLSSLLVWASVPNLGFYWIPISFFLFGILILGPLVVSGVHDMLKTVFHFVYLV